MTPPRPDWRGELRAAWLALTFLTTLPLPHLPQLRGGDFARASGYYPLAGYAVGGLVSLALWLPLPLPAGVHGALALGGWLLLTGMLHFDGLVDSADALFAMKSPEQRLDILRDVHVGAFGLATGTLTLLTFWSLLSAPLPTFAPLIAAVAGRTLLLLPMQLYPAARRASPEMALAGTASPGTTSLGASSRGGKREALVALVLALPTLLLPGAWAAWLAALVTVLLLARFAAARLGGGLNGDTYGMIVTVTELAALCALAWGLPTGGAA
ncbi:adenosylcobinamide-GDP ribazoletransferase [Deinococcus sp.]|uniref:adenosylcobinamide-GDP ribazoletransferase n=1 Tax=Deinococcus sp. TaxID=47478 RepID=UPI0025C27539|nr:adenosylcobinamide-GDP ribazoletransferase [Deinococcus sp.]